MRNRLLGFGLALQCCIGLPAWAMCDLTWQLDGKNIGSGSITLKIRDGDVGQVDGRELRALMAARRDMEKASGIHSHLVLCADMVPNAFAFRAADGTPAIAVTKGMADVVGRDVDIAAAVLGHEYAHHAKNHIAERLAAQAGIKVVGAMAGVVLEYLIERRAHVLNAGAEIANTASTLAILSFTRDQEREADAQGVKYMVATGHDADAAIRLWQRMLSTGNAQGGILSTHPGGAERIENIKVTIAETPRPQGVAKSDPEAPASPLDLKEDIAAWWNGQETKSSAVLPDDIEKPRGRATAIQTPSLPPDKLYDRAFSFIREPECSSPTPHCAPAEREFQGFIDTYPESELVPAAMFWLAQLSYAQGRYDEAAARFLDVYVKYPSHPKGGESLYRVGTILNKMGKRDDACTCFGRFLDEFPDGPDAYKKLAKSERQKLGCSSAS